MRTQLAAIFRPLLTALVLLAAFGLPALAEDNVRLQRSSPLQQVAAVASTASPTTTARRTDWSKRPRIWAVPRGCHAVVLYRDVLWPGVVEAHAWGFHCGRRQGRYHL